MHASAKLKSKALKALPWSFLESVINAGVGIGQIFAISWLLRPEDMGTAAVALAIAGAFELIANFGLAEAVIAAPSSHTKLTDSAFTGVMLSSVLFFLICVALASPVASLYGDDKLVGLIIMAAFMIPINNYICIPAAIFTRKLRAGVVTLRILVGRITTLVATTILALSNLGAWAIVGGALISSAVTLVILMPAVQRSPKIRLNFSELRTLISFGAAINVERLLWSGMTRLFWLIIGYLHGPQILGYFQFAQRLVDETANLIQTFAIRFGLAFFSGLKRSGQDPVSAYTKASRLVGVVAAPIFAGIALVLPDAIGSVFDSRWVPAVAVSQLAAIGWLIAFPRVLVGPVLRAQGQVNTLIRYAAGSFVATLLAAVATGSSGLLAIGLAWVVRHIFGFIWSAYAIRRYIGIQYVDQLRPHVGLILNVAIMSTFVALTAYQVPDWTNAERFVIEVLVGVTSYVTLFCLVDRSNYRLLREVMAGVRRRKGLG